MSYQALPSPNQAALRALALLPPKPNSITHAAALAVIGSNEDADNSATGTQYTVRTLINSGLVEAAETDRYTLHQTVADYARLSPPASDAVERMVAFFVDSLAATPDDHDWHDWMAQEQTNIVAALYLAAEQELNARCIQGVEAFHPFAENRGLYTLIDPLLALAVDRAQAQSDTAAAIRLLFKRSTIAIQQGDIAAGEQFVQVATMLARDLAQPTFVIPQLMHLGVFSIRRGNYTQAELYFQQGLALAETAEDPDKTAALLTNLGALHFEQGNFVKSKPYLRQSFELALAHGYRERACGALVNLIRLCIEQSEYAEAANYLGEGLQLAHATEHRLLLCILLRNQGILAMRQGQFAGAADSLRESLALARTLANPLEITEILCEISEVAIAQKNLVAAEEALQEALSLAQQNENQKELCGVHLRWGQLHQLQGYPEARTAYQTTLTIARRVGMRLEEAQALFGLALLAKQAGDFAPATELGQESLRLFDEIGHHLAATVRHWLAEDS